jgi:hypothetical protein
MRFVFVKAFFKINSPHLLGPAFDLPARQLALGLLRWSCLNFVNRPKSESKPTIKRRRKRHVHTAFSAMALRALISAQKAAERENARFGLKLIVLPKRASKRKLTPAS